jgi:hypothetical protein
MIRMVQPGAIPAVAALAWMAMTTACAADLHATPADQSALVRTLAPGDRLPLAPGDRAGGLQVHGLHGTARAIASVPAIRPGGRDLSDDPGTIP